jgi:hypothetical protein
MRRWTLIERVIGWQDGHLSYDQAAGEAETIISIPDTERTFDGPGLAVFSEDDPPGDVRVEVVEASWARGEERLPCGHGSPMAELAGGECQVCRAERAEALQGSAEVRMQEAQVKQLRAEAEREELRKSKRWFQDRYGDCLGQLSQAEAALREIAELPSVDPEMLDTARELSQDRAIVIARAALSDMEDSDGK